MAPLLCIPRLLRDAEYRAGILRSGTDPVVLSYWRHTFDKYDDRRRAEVIDPILNKLDAFLSFPKIRGIVGQTTNTIDLRKIIDERRILIVNINKGLIGEPALLLACLLMSSLSCAAFSRSNIVEEERVPFYLYGDEFQNYSIPSMSDDLSELRKYKMYLTIAHQFTAQIQDIVHKAIFANVASLICFRIGALDSPLIARHYEDNPERLQNLANFTALLRPLVNGAPGDPILFNSLPPRLPLHTRSKILIKNSEVRFGRDSTIIESKIKKFLAAPLPTPQRRRPRLTSNKPNR